MEPELIRAWFGQKKPRFSHRKIVIAVLVILLFFWGSRMVLGEKMVWKEPLAMFRTAVDSVFHRVKTTVRPTKEQVSRSIPGLSQETPGITPKQERMAVLQSFCQSDPNSEQCQRVVLEIVNKECGGDIEAPECEKIRKEITVFFSESISCEKDPDSPICRCVKSGKKLGTCFANAILCPMQIAFRQKLGFNIFKKEIDCGNFAGGSRLPSTTAVPSVPQPRLTCLENPYAPGCQEFLQNHCQNYPYQPECAAFFEASCPGKVYDTGCRVYCQQNPYSQGCLPFLVQYCKGRMTDSLCMSVLCQRSPQLCVICQRFPNLCNRLGVGF